jgi:hypothetical protein
VGTIIQFPKQNKNNITVEDVDSNIDDVKQYHIYEAVSAIVPSLLQQMALAGFDVTDDDSDVGIKDGAFLVEALKSMLCRHYGIYHPFQKVAESIFLDNNETDGLEIAEKISIDFSVDNEN